MFFRLIVYINILKIIFSRFIIFFYLSINNYEYNVSLWYLKMNYNIYIKFKGKF